MTLKKIAFLRNISVQIWVAIFAWILAHIAILVYSTQSPDFHYHFYGADSLYLPSLSRDLTSGYDLSGWKLTPAPYFFPDILIFFAAGLVTQNIHTSIWINAVAQNILFLTGIICLTKSLNLKPLAVAFSIFICSMLLIASRNILELMPMLISGFHFGIVIVMCFALAIVIHVWHDGNSAKKSSFALLAVLCSLATPSDLLFIVQFLAPAIAALLLTTKARRFHLNHAMLSSGALALYSLIGLLIERAIPRHRSIEEYGMSNSARFAQTLSDIQLIASQFAQAHPLFALALAAIFGACLIIALAGLIHPDTLCSRITFIALFLVLQLCISFLFLAVAPVASARYLLPSFTLMIVLAPALIISVMQLPNFLVNLFFMSCAIASIIISASSLKYFPDIRQLNQYYNDFVECVDQGVRLRGAHRGLAQYWQARQISMLSRAGLDVVAVGSNLSIYHWINNLYWYDHNDFDFVMIDPSMPDFMRFTRADVISRFGQPSDEFDCGGTNILTYTDPQNHVAFRSQFKNNPALIRLKNAGESTTYPANLLNSQVGTLVGHTRTISDSNPSGFLTYGPYVHLLEGAYQFELAYSASAPSSHWDVSISSPTGQPVILQKGELEPAKAGRVTNSFVLDQEAFVEIRAFYGGIGELSVQDITLKRLR